jgi:hypothetical protein
VRKSNIKHNRINAKSRVCESRKVPFAAKMIINFAEDQKGDLYYNFRNYYIFKGKVMYYLFILVVSLITFQLLG